MAQIYTWDLQGWRDSYSKYVYIQKECGAKNIKICKCTGRIETYSRNYFRSMEIFRLRATNIVNHLQLPQGSKILVVGTAFGFLMEQLQKLGMVPYGLDNSNYIQQQVNMPKNPQRIQFPIHDIDVTSNTFVQQVQSKIGISKFDCIITEDVLTSHDTFTTILNNCEAVLDVTKTKKHIVHLVDLTAGPMFMIKSTHDWIAVQPQHTWTDIAGEVLNADN